MTEMKIRGGPPRIAGLLIHRRSAAAPRVTASTIATRGALTPATATRLCCGALIPSCDHRRDAATTLMPSPNRASSNVWHANDDGQQCAKALEHLKPTGLKTLAREAMTVFYIKKKKKKKKKHFQYF